MKSTVETKIIELVKLGHELAKELHCAESAALVSDLALQLEVQLVRSNALAAENARLKELIEQHANSVAVCPNCSHEEPSETDDIVALYRSMETPALDAFLAELRANCVDAVKQKISDAISGCYQDEMVGLDAAVNIASEFAAQLR